MNLFLIQHKNETLSTLIAISMWRLLQQISVLPVNATVYRRGFNRLRYITSEQPNFVQIPASQPHFVYFQSLLALKVSLVLARLCTQLICHFLAIWQIHPTA